MSRPCLTSRAAPAILSFTAALRQHCQTADDEPTPLTSQTTADVLALASHTRLRNAAERVIDAMRAEGFEAALQLDLGDLLGMVSDWALIGALPEKVEAR